MAIDTTVAFLKAEVAEFERCRGALLDSISDLRLRADVSKFINGCMHYCTGNLTWSLSTKRYGFTSAMTGESYLVQL